LTAISAAMAGAVMLSAARLSGVIESLFIVHIPMLRALSFRERELL